MTESTERICPCGCGLPVRNQWRQGHNRRPFGLISDADKFWLLVDRNGPVLVPELGECWLWQGNRRAGRSKRYVYGRFQPVGEKMVSAHRYAYELEVGPIPEGLEIDHLCRNGLCVRPSHLEAVTHSVNVLRCDHHKRRKTHCPAGHPYDAENTYVCKQGKRHCKACARARDTKGRSDSLIAPAR